MVEAVLSVDLPETLQAELEKQADRERVSPSVIVERAVGAYIASTKAKYDAIDEALAEADKGVFISGEAVMRWVESWGSENELPPPEPDIVLK